MLWTLCLCFYFEELWINQSTFSFVMASVDIFLKTKLHNNYYWSTSTIIVFTITECKNSPLTHLSKRDWEKKELDPLPTEGGVTK